jgi:hypothetical protein
VKPINPLWYTAAFLFALGSIMLGAAVASSGWTPVKHATVLSIPTRVDAADKSLAVFTDIVQPGRHITCTATRPDKTVTTILKPGLAVRVTSGSEQWHLIGLLHDGSDGLKVACTPRDKRHDDATYGYAAVSGFESKYNAGKGISILGVTIGLGSMAYIYYLQRRRRRYAALDALTDSE